MNSRQFKTWLARRGCTFKRKPGSGHLMVLRGDRVSELPMHGGRKQLGKGLMRKIQRDLGLR